MDPPASGELETPKAKDSIQQPHAQLYRTARDPKVGRLSGHIPSPPFVPCGARTTASAGQDGKPVASP